MCLDQEADLNLNNILNYRLQWKSYFAEIKMGLMILNIQMKRMVLEFITHSYTTTTTTTKHHLR